MLETLNDIVKHTNGLGTFSMFRVSGTDKEVRIESVDADKTTIFYGILNKPDQDFVGEFGVGDLGRLNLLLNHPNFKSDKASVQLVRTNKNGVMVPTSISFANKAMDSEGDHRLMDSSLVPEGKFVGKDWDIVVAPTKSKISEFSSFANLEATRSEQYFMPKVEGGKLKFYFGEPNSATHSSHMCFAENVTGNLANGLYWNSPMTLSILKLGMDCNPVMSIMSKGAMKISFKTDYAEYNYVLRAHRK